MGPFLDPDYIRSLNLRAIWNYREGSRLLWPGIRVWGHKGIVSRPRSIGTERVRSQLLFYSFL